MDSLALLFLPLRFGLAIQEACAACFVANAQLFRATYGALPDPVMTYYRNGGFGVE